MAADVPKDGFPQLGHLKQFVLMCTKPETEESFQSHAATAEIRKAFHGSPCHNWHSILRDGLNFDKKSHGRAFGASNSSLSLSLSLSLFLSQTCNHVLLLLTN
jgi:hypothetical protein